MDEYVKSSGNVFADLGLPNPEERLAKAELARQIELAMQDRELTHRDVMAILGINPTEMASLLSGKLASFDVEQLSKFLRTLA